MELQLTEELISLALADSEGNLSQAAKSLGVTRGTIYNYLRRFPALQTILGDARETMLDTAESALLKALRSGEAWAVCFTLKTIGRKRGYVEKHELEVINDPAKSGESALQTWLARAATAQGLSEPLEPTPDNIRAAIEAMRPGAQDMPDLLAFLDQKEQSLARGQDSEAVS